jgi:hypothetical protein
MTLKQKQKRILDLIENERRLKNENQKNKKTKIN